jgi:predicted  nucleic acid-binding Zn-ribbon protein
MQSLFDNIEDISVQEPKPPRSKKGLFIALGVVAGLAALGTGGFVLYRAIHPLKLTERAIPQRPDELLTELKQARDSIDVQTRDVYARIQQFNQRQENIGRKPVSFSQVFLQGLSAEEEQALDELVKQEKDPSYRGVLGQVVEDMKKIRDLQTKVSELEAKLPGEGIEAKPGDTHFKLAKEWLIKEHKVPETRAKELAERLNLYDGRLEKGFKVYFYYDPAKDFFGSWISAGDSKRTPLAIVRAKELKLMEERDTAIAQAKDLAEKKADLEETLAKLQQEIADLEARKASLETNVASLESAKSTAEEKVKTTTAELEQQRNAMFYEADLAERLRARGVLRTFNKIDAIGEVKFSSMLDLRSEKSITLKPSQFGIDHIRDVRVVPSFLKEGRDIGVKFVEDGTVELTVLDEKAVKGQKILFVVEQ